MESFIWHCWKYKLLCHQGFTHNEPVLFIHHNLINWDHIYLLCNMKFKKYFKINARKSIYYHILNPDDSYGVPKILLAITSLYDMLAFLLWQKNRFKKVLSKSLQAGKSAPYYVGSAQTLPRGHVYTDRSKNSMSK